MAMTKIKAGSSTLPIYKETIGGEDVFVVIAQGKDDGGVVTVTYVKDADGVLRENRTWRGSGTGPDIDDATKLQARDTSIAFSEVMPPEELTIRRDLAKLQSNKLTTESREQIGSLHRQLTALENAR